MPIPALSLACPVWPIVRNAPMEPVASYVTVEHICIRDCVTSTVLSFFTGITRLSYASVVILVV